MEYEKGRLVAKLRGARERKRKETGKKVGGRKTHAELWPEARRLRRAKDKPAASATVKFQRLPWLRARRLRRDQCPSPPAYGGVIIAASLNRCARASQRYSNDVDGGVLRKLLRPDAPVILELSWQPELDPLSTWCVWTP